MFIFSYLLSMAKSRSAFLREVESLSSEINRHLVKVLSINDLDNEGHWIKELDAWLIHINQTTLKSGAPGWKTIYSSIWEYNDRLPKAVLLNYAGKGGHALVYENYKKACGKYIPLILEEFCRLPLRTYETIWSLDSFKDALENRDKSNSTLYSWNELRKV